MVKFGRHVNVFQEDNAEAGLFVVPYNEIKRIEDPAEFETTWRQQLDQASRDFHEAITTLWNGIYSDIRDDSEARGAPPSVALSLYAEQAGKKSTREVLVRLKQIQEAAMMNSEALRKLVKKHDKYSTDQQLSSSLIPLIYTSNFAIGRAQLLDDIALIRQVLEGDDSSSSSSSVESFHQQIVQGRQSELEWLNRVTQSLEPEELDRLVAHRGFHCIDDDLQRRPIENSLTAYETAWTSGIHHCECDIALTKDEKIVLAHDEDFSRLALDHNSPLSNKRISELTFKQLLALPLTTIARPSLLIDVLRSANAIGEYAKLVIEIKPGNQAAATALAQLFLEHPELVPSVSVVMSFDAYTIHILHQELKAWKLKAKVGNLTNYANRQELENPTDCAYPKLMLLTVAEPPDMPCKLRVGVDDLSPLDRWLKGSLDGVYMQFQPSMLKPEGSAALKELSQRYHVGIWGHAYVDPDDYQTFSTLVREGNVSFVNTDLPSDFRKGIMVQGE